MLSSASMLLAALLALAAAHGRPEPAPAAELPRPPEPIVGAQSTGGAAATLEALGVVRAPTPGRSVAILRSEGRTRVVAVGETAFGARLTAIDAESVTLEMGGRSVELKLRSAPAPARAAPLASVSRPDPAASDGPPEDPATPAREMEKRQVQIRLGEEMNRILSETAIAPVTEDGRVVGVQITRLPEGSLLSDAGLRAGDVLTRINDTQIDGMGTLIGLWPRLQSATELHAVVLRGGQPVSLRVTLR